MPRTPWGKSSSSPGHGLIEAVYARDAVARLDDGADLGHVHGRVELGNLPPDDIRDLSGLNFHPLTLLIQKRFAEPAQLRAEAAIDDGSVQLHHDPAD
jgi:hypothetical protein